jgi:hypothetical protein
MDISARELALDKPIRALSLSEHEQASHRGVLSSTYA